VPPCGLVFLKDSGSGTYTVEITVTWDISWVGTGHPNPTALPTGRFTTHQTFGVREIQAVNR
jgi:enoyl reductase